jgi:actin-like ATPase involved in cell morphogenesis
MDGGTLSFVKDPTSVGFSVPSNVFVTPQGQMLVGMAANNRCQSDPLRYRRELKRDLGKSTPIFLGTHPFLPEQLIAHIFSKIRNNANSQMESIGKPLFTGAVLTIPATYQEHKRTLMHKAATQAGFSSEELTLLTEPEAAALYYARQSNLTEGEILLVYDLGGGTFDTALLQKRENGFEYLTPPAGIERCGGVDFDRSIYTDLIRENPELQAVLQGERDDKAALTARMNIGEMCINLKHQLSETEEAEISFVTPGSGRFIEYHLSRTAFNQMITPTIQETLTCCQQMIQQANLSKEQISRILLVGGSCRIPYVQQMLQRTLGCPMSAAPDLELVVCQGAALYAAQYEVYIVSPVPRERDFTTIGETLQQARSKSRIVVRPGTYRESLVLDREVDIVGVGPRESVIIESAAPIGLKMSTATALVQGVTLKHTGTEDVMWNTHGGVVVAQGHLVLENCTIETSIHSVSIWGPEGKVTLRQCSISAGKNAGIAINNGGQGTLEDCDIFDNADVGIHVRDKNSLANILRCNIHNGQSFGISISSEGQALIEDCDIAENAAAGIQILDDKSSAQISRSRIHDGKDKGVAVWQKGQAVLEQCEISGHVYEGVRIGNKGSGVSLRQCQIHNGKHTGVSIWDQGQGTLENCEIYENTFAGVQVGDKGSNATLLRCHIHHGNHIGVNIWKHGQVTLEQCEISGHVYEGVRIGNKGSGVSLRQCQIHNGKYTGVSIWDQSQGTLEDCEIYENTFAGVQVGDEGSSAMLLRCHIHHGKHIGINIWKHGQVVLEECDIFTNTYEEIRVGDYGSSITVRRSGIHDSKHTGIGVWNRGQALVEHCDIFGNAVAGIKVGDPESALTLRGSQVRHGNNLGIALTNRGKAILEDCEIHSNGGPEISIQDGGSNMTVERCKIHDGRGDGVQVNNQGYAILNFCQINRNRGCGVHIVGRGTEATVNQCAVGDSMVGGNTKGVAIENGGKGILKSCAFANNGSDVNGDRNSQVIYQ